MTKKRSPMLMIHDDDFAVFFVLMIFTLEKNNNIFLRPFDFLNYFLGLNILYWFGYGTAGYLGY